MRKVKIAAVVIVLLSVVYILLSFVNRMTGTVVDAETGTPIEGAVMLVEWTITCGLPGLSHTNSFKVVEALTDKNGQFTVYAVPNPFVNAPDIAAYKKGYVTWNNKWIFPNWKIRNDFTWHTGYVFRLERFNKGYSYDEHLSFIRSAIHSGMAVGKKNVFKAAIAWEETEAFKERQQKRVK